MMSLGKSYIALLICTMLMVSTSFANTTTAEDQEIETRLKALSTELRCLVCQNTTLSDSNAPLAEDLRNEIRTLMREGKTDEEVTAYLVARYGDFVRYKPPVQANTALLWFGPFVILLIGAVLLFKVLKKQATSQVEGGEERTEEVNE
ncbi:MAG: cytochrome c-type biogenesis protein [Methylophilus sp.]